MTADPVMPDTRVVMTEADFEYNAADPGDFLSLGSAFVGHLDEIFPALADDDAADIYSFEGFSRAQRVLLMWRLVHGQIMWNGFGDFGFASNERDNLDRAKSMLRDLAWPEFSERFEAAVDEYCRDPRNGDPPSVLEDEVHWPRVKPAFQRFVLLNLWPKWLLPHPDKLTLRGKLSTPDVILKLWFMRAVDLGKFHAPGNPYYDHVRGPRPSTKQQDAFEKWFGDDQTQEEARTVVEAYIRANRDSLCRLPSTPAD